MHKFCELYARPSVVEQSIEHCARVMEKPVCRAHFFASLVANLMSSLFAHGFLHCLIRQVSGHAQVL